MATNRTPILGLSTRRAKATIAFWLIASASCLCATAPAVAALYSDGLTGLPGLIRYWALNEAAGSTFEG
ncbi:MAG: hypothetical protein GX621_09395 [Pirellulaceae bacterium]|nr:hypothetical protein [Pirellulaceae bacterium]